jgi:hypothetical protein
MSMRQDAQSNRERDDRIDVALGLYQGVMAYDLEVRFEGERTGLQKDHMVRMIVELELDRAAQISDKTTKVSGNAAFEEARIMITDKRWNRPCGIRLRSFFAGDLSDSPWDGQQELAGLETDDEFDREQLTYQWRKDPSLGRWGARKYAIRGWENKVLHDQVQLQCWEDRERLLLKLMIEMTQGEEFVAGVLSGVPYPTVLPIQIRNVAIGGGQRAYVIFAASDVAAALLIAPAAVPLLERFGVSLMTVDDYKAVLTSTDDNVGSQVTDVTEAEREGRMMVIWGATEAMTAESLQSFFDQVHGPAQGSVYLVEPKRAYAPPNKLYVMVTQKVVEGSDDAARALLMSELIKCEPQAQARYNSQAITFKKSKSRIERAADKATWASVTRVRDGTLSQQSQQSGQSSMMSQTQLNQVINAFKNACLHDQAYQQQMAAALIHQMKAEFKAMAKEVGIQVVASLTQWRRDTAVELDQQFQESLDQGLVSACGRTGTYVASSPAPANVTMMNPQSAAEAQRQQQRQADRMNQQNIVHDSSREPTMMSPSPMNMQSQQFMTPPAGQFPSQQSMAAQVDPGMAQQMLNHMLNSGGNFHQ